MAEWEYCEAASGIDTEWLKALNRLGDAGWELMVCFVPKGHPGVMRFIFKRRKIKERKPE